MKKSLHKLLIGLFLAATTFACNSQAEEVATCYGRNPCYACKNCSKCAHCSQRGGVCGVCK